ncbi:hypothetical protein DYB32_001985 [Aphanomyces invadans]|uniref:TFIIS N-terminal domain-containing protein n=1 Tax=Aphanomyces invadans TaxID=157072 RepID=A0A418B4K7_9STRA|nr:hypothetical protein DYB32_001985 [Aphanomyces invadans]
MHQTTTVLGPVLGSSSNPSAVNESASGLFGSDSESDADEQPKKLKKATPAPKKKSASKPPKPAQRKPQRSAADDDDEDSLKPPPRGKEVVRTKDDEAFIDDEDDLGGVLDEYNQEKQDDDDDDEGERYSRGGGGREDDYFEETLKSMKSGRGRSKMKLSPQEIESLVQLKLVDKLAILLRKVQLQLPMLDFNLLEVGRMCCSLGLDKEHLKRSGFGKVIMILWKHPDESPENKEVCRQLIDRWSRNVFSKTLDFSKLGELEAEKREANGGALSRPDRRLPSRGMEAVRNKGFLNKAAPTETSGGSERVRMPEQIRIDFTMRPQPKVDATQIPSTKLDPESKKARLMKRMQVIARPTKRAKRAVKMSIEGRGLQS